MQFLILCFKKSLDSFPIFPKIEILKKMEFGNNWPSQKCTFFKSFRVLCVCVAKRQEDENNNATTIS